MRGKLVCNEEGKLACGITPAGAGKTLSVLLTPSAFQDHPRRCGENSVGLLNAICITGSPPQVRGKPLIKQIESLEGGITPAGAGKTHT